MGCEPLIIKLKRLMKGQKEEALFRPLWKWNNTQQSVLMVFIDRVIWKPRWKSEPSGVRTTRFFRNSLVWKVWMKKFQELLNPSEK